jgi:hypothetical protein
VIFLRDVNCLMALLRRLLADARHHFIPDDLSCEDRVVRTELMAGPNQITDRYLVALARQYKLTLATKRLPCLDGLPPRYMLATWAFWAASFTFFG